MISRVGVVAPRHDAEALIWSANGKRRHGKTKE